MKSDVTIERNGNIEKLANGNRELKDVKWVFEGNVGYIFPDPATLNISNQTESGRWSDITDEKNISNELIEKNVFTLWYNHGNQPSNGSYQYLVVPNVNINRLAVLSATNCNINVLANSSNLQAVKHNKLQIIYAAFYKSGEVEIAPDLVLKSDSQGMVLLKLQNGTIQQITVSDPSRKLSRLALTINGVVHLAKGDNYRTIYNNKNETLFLIDLPQKDIAGKSVTIQL